MGALHPGHISLIERARKECRLTIASIFVNPLQFNDKADLERYPRTPEKDLAMLQHAGCDMVYMPEVNDLYPPGEPEPSLDLDLGVLDQVMEGAHRPGHFKGVCIVVNRLFDKVKPDKAYFGEKDYQQVAVIRHLVRTLKIPVEIISCPTLRETDGLAMSSRNMLLTHEHRKAAPAIYKSMLDASQNKKDFRSGEDVRRMVKEKVESNGLLKLEYFEIVNADTLQPLSVLEYSHPLRACIAVKAGAVRLIDNIPF